MHASGTSYYYLHDGHGIIIGPHHQRTGTRDATYTYDPYGNTTTTATGIAATNPFRYNSGYQDPATGYYHYGARYYNPATGPGPNSTHPAKNPATPTPATTPSTPVTRVGRASHVFRNVLRTPLTAEP